MLYVESTMYGQVLDENFQSFFKKAFILLILRLMPLVTSIFEIVFNSSTPQDLIKLCGLDFNF